MKKVVEGGGKRYYINVKEYKWVCDPCPKYTPKHSMDTLEHLKLRLELLESQAEQLQQVVSQGGVGEGLEKLRGSLERLRKELKS